jgi:type II secretory pathway component PulF
MFAYPAVIWAAFLPSVKQGLSDSLPAYQRFLLDIAVFCIDWRWLLLLPLLGLGVLFTIAGLTASRPRRQV